MLFLLGSHGSLRTGECFLLCLAISASFLSEISFPTRRFICPAKFAPPFNQIFLFLPLGADFWIQNLENKQFFLERWTSS